MIAILALLTLALPVTYLLWYRARCKPRQQVKAFLRQGATLPDFTPNSSDLFYPIKRQIEKNPDIKAFTDDLTGKARIMFIDTELIKTVLTNPQHYCRRDKSSKLSQMVINHGLTFTNGKIWKLHRKVITGVFQYNFFSDMIPVIVNTTEEALKLSQHQEKTIQVPFDIELISADIITRLFFGIKSHDIIINGNPASEEISIILLTNRAMNLAAAKSWVGKCALVLNPAYYKQKQRIRNFRKVFGERIQNRMHELEAENLNSDETDTTEKKRDLLRLLLQHRMQNKHDLSETLSDDDILDEFAVFYVAGKDTTAILISMTLYRLTLHTEWAQKLRKEVDDTIKDFHNLSLDALNSMDLMTAVLYEVLRMHPPAPFLLERMAMDDHMVGNFEVKKGTMVNTFFLVNNYNPKYFNEPEEFNPERWFKSHPTDERWKMDPFSYLPFSGGQKSCIGKNLALMEAKIILSMILKDYNFELADPKTPIKLGPHSIGYGPVDPVPLKLIPRQVS